MNISYRKAVKEDAELLIQIYNSSFYEDFVKYGECPAYGRTREGMEMSIDRTPKQIIFVEQNPVGVISVENRGEGEYYVGCLCVIPAYQRKGIGSQAIEQLKNYYKDWRCITLITPADKQKNILFYTERCGFQIDGSQMDGSVKVVHLELKRE